MQTACPRRGALGAIAALACVVFATVAVGHAWQYHVPDMAPDEIETVVAALEASLETEPPDGWTIPEDYGDASYDIAVEYGIATGNTRDIDFTTERVLGTYDALKYGVVDEAGQLLAKEDLFLWLETFRPEDAPAVAPFVLRLDTWRAAVLEVARP